MQEIMNVIRSPFDLFVGWQTRVWLGEKKYQVNISTSRIGREKAKSRIFTSLISLSCKEKFFQVLNFSQNRAASCQRIVLWSYSKNLSRISWYHMTYLRWRIFMLLFSATDWGPQAKLDSLRYWLNIFQFTSAVINIAVT